MQKKEWKKVKKMKTGEDDEEVSEGDETGTNGEASEEDDNREEDEDDDDDDDEEEEENGTDEEASKEDVIKEPEFDDDDDDDDDDEDDEEEGRRCPKGRVGHSLHLYYELSFSKRNACETLLNGDDKEEDTNEDCVSEGTEEEGATEGDKISSSELGTSSETDSVSESETNYNFEEISESDESSKTNEINNSDGFSSKDSTSDALEDVDSRFIKKFKTKKRRTLQKKQKRKKESIVEKCKLVLFGGGILEETFAQVYTSKYCFFNGHDRLQDDHKNTCCFNIENGLYKTFNDVYICAEENDDFKNWKLISTHNAPDPRAFHGSCIVNLGLNGVFLIIHGGKTRNKALAGNSLYALNLSDASAFLQNTKEEKKKEKNCKKILEEKKSYSFQSSNREQASLNKEVMTHMKEGLNSLSDTEHFEDLKGKRRQEISYEKKWKNDTILKIQRKDGTWDYNEEHVNGPRPEKKKKGHHNEKNHSYIQEICVTSSNDKKNKPNFNEDSSVHSSPGVTYEVHNIRGNMCPDVFVHSSNLSSSSDTLDSKTYTPSSYENKLGHHNNCEKAHAHIDSSENSSEASINSTFSNLTDISFYSSIENMSHTDHQDVFLFNKNMCDYKNVDGTISGHVFQGGKRTVHVNNLKETQTEKDDDFVRQWVEIEVSGRKPSSRYGHTLDFVYPYLVLFGGNEKIGDSEKDHIKGDLWVLNLEKYERKKKEKKEENKENGNFFFTWQEVEYKTVNPSGRFFHSTCIWYDKKKKKKCLILYGGIMKNEMYANRLFCLQNKGTQWFWDILPVYLEGISEQRAYHTMIHMKNYIFILGGEEYKYKYIEKLPSAAYSLETKKFQYIDNFQRRACLKCFAKNDYIFTWGGFTDIPFRKIHLPKKVDFMYIKPHIFEMLRSVTIFEDVEDSEYVIKAEIAKEYNTCKIINNKFLKVEKKQNELEKNISLQMKINTNLNDQLRMQTLKNQELLQILHFKQRQNSYLLDMLKKTGNTEILNQICQVDQMNQFNDTRIQNVTTIVGWHDGNVQHGDEQQRNEQKNAIHNVTYNMDCMFYNAGYPIDMSCKGIDTAVDVAPSSNGNEYSNRNYANCINELSGQGTFINSNFDNTRLNQTQNYFQTPLNSNNTINNSSTLEGAGLVKPNEVCNKSTNANYLNNQKSNQSGEQLPMESHYSMNASMGAFVNSTENVADFALPVGNDSLNSMSLPGCVYENNSNNISSNMNSNISSNTNNSISINMNSNMVSNASSNMTSNMSSNVIINMNSNVTSNSATSSNYVKSNSVCLNNVCTYMANPSCVNVNTDMSNIGGSNAAFTEHASNDIGVSVITVNANEKIHTPRVRRKTAEKCLQLIETDRLNRLKKQ